jgi:hypothetical protein
MTNIKLLTWYEFQDFFTNRWIRTQIERVRQDGENLRNYCDPLEDYVSRRLRESGDDFRQKYNDLAVKYMPIGVVAHEWQLEEALIGDDTKIKESGTRDRWQFMENLVCSLKEGLEAFDFLFGEKWRYRI